MRRLQNLGVDLQCRRAHGLNRIEPPRPLSSGPADRCALRWTQGDGPRQGLGLGLGIARRDQPTGLAIGHGLAGGAMGGGQDRAAHDLGLDRGAAKGFGLE